VTAVTIEGLSSDPHPILHRLRESEPVSWVPALDAWLVTSHDQCTTVMLGPETFTVDDPRFSTQQVIGPSMLSLDGPEHRRHRDPFAPPFRARRIRELAATARAEARRLVGDFRQSGSGDLRSLIAAPLAVTLMAELLDLDGVDTGDILSWYREIVAAVHAVTAGEEVPTSGQQAFVELSRAVTSGTAGSRFLSPISETGSLTADEMVSNVAVLLFGGIVTAESSTAIAFRYLLDDPDLLQRIDEHRSLLGGFVEETLRLEPSAAAVDRYATRDVEIGGAFIASGDLVRVSVSAGNRDPRVFPDPDRLDPSRDNSGHNLTFARGPHACLGIHLARLEVTVAVESLLDGVAGLEAARLDPVEGLVFRAPATVHATVS
jgi:cytochrome P450